MCWIAVGYRVCVPSGDLANVTTSAPRFRVGSRYKCVVVWKTVFLSHPGGGVDDLKLFGKLSFPSRQDEGGTVIAEQFCCLEETLWALLHITKSQPNHFSSQRWSTSQSWHVPPHLVFLFSASSGHTCWVFVCNLRSRLASGQTVMVSQYHQHRTCFAQLSQQPAVA